MAYKFSDPLGLLEGTPLSLEGKTAIITGAGSGMGQATAILFAKQGCMVGICDINEEGMAETVQIINEKYPNAKTISMIGDVTNHDQVISIVDKFASEAGRIDILIHYAGYNDEYSFEDITPDLWNKTIGINLTGTYNIVHAVIPYMVKQNSGKIVATGSTAGMAGGATLAHYAASKAGVAGMIKSVAKQYAPNNITANILAPGTARTNLTMAFRTNEDMVARGKKVPLGRQVEPMEIAFLSLLLASKAGDMITGQQISINGGEFIVGI